MNNENFSAVHSKLDGALLIEASAGTGKTYSLMHILLRLIVEKNIPIERILLVTFTKAATQEMRFRLRSLLMDTVQKLDEGGEITDPTLKDQLKEWIPDEEPEKKQIVIDRMKRALEGLEDISVETIHAFCQKMLNNYGFSSGKIAESEVGEDSDIIHKVLDEQMRKYTRLNPDNGLLFMALPEDYLEVALKGVLSMPDDPDYGDFEVCLNTAKISGSNASIRYYRQNNLEDVENILNNILTGSASEKAVEETVKILLNVKKIEEAEEEIKKLLKVDPKKVESKIKKNKSNLQSLLKKADEIDDIENTIKEKLKKTTKSDVCQKLEKTISDNLVKIDNIENTFKNLLDSALKIKDVENVLNDLLEGAVEENNIENTIKDLLDSALKIKDVENVLNDLLEGAVEENNIENTIKDLLRNAAKEVKSVKEELRLMTFDDMLVRMYEEVKRNPSFAEVVRSQFDAVLIDEFQDTDPMQYKIFSTLFLDSKFLDRGINEKKDKTFVCFVGDPKQSIYRFRSADLATYLEASKEIGRTETLTKNYRSFSGIVKGINEFFSLSLEAGEKALPLLEKVNGQDEELPAFPFGQENLPFFVSQVGKKGFPILKKTPKGYEAIPAFEMWWNTPDSKNYTAINDARKEIDKMIACDIDRLVNDKNICIYDDSLNGEEFSEKLRRIEPSDIAILVERRSDANGVEEALRDKGIRCLRSSRDNVLDTEERDEILAVLKALEEPENSRRMTAARATRIFYESLKTILDNEDMAQEDRQLMDYLKSNYSKFGLSKTFKELFSKKHTVEHLLPLKNGERILANYEQLIEILHAQSKTLQSLPGLIRWFDKEESSGGMDNGDRSVRRETDDDVVQIETIHRSKGLEYPIVYLPSANRKRDTKARDYKKFFLNQKGQNNLFFYADTPKKGDPIKDAILKEQENEANRLAYVAMTRASSRLVIPFLQKFNVDGGAGDVSFNNPYGRILGGDGKAVNSYRNKLSDRFGLLQKDIEAEVRERFREKKGKGELTFPENVAVIKKDAPLTSSYKKEEDPEKAPILDVEETNSRSPQWLQSSFSAIVRGLHSEIEYKGMDEGEEEPKPEGSPDPDTLSFDGGAAFGDFLHRIIEKTSFDLGKEENVEELTEHVFRFFKTDGRIKEDGEPNSEEVKAIVRMFQEITRVEIFPGIRLINVGKKEKSPELEFLLGGISEGKRLSVEQLVKALHELMPNQFKDFHPEDRMISGYLTGSMDMVFFAEDKYWLIDWKSNFARKENGDLVTDANGYTPERINALMDKNFYHLQYLLYLVGLRRFLNLRLNVEESYDLIGGIGYVFLRGVRANRKDQAIYRYRPPLALILALDDLLTNGYDQNKIEEWKQQLEKGED